MWLGKDFTFLLVAGSYIACGISVVLVHVVMFGSLWQSWLCHLLQDFGKYPRMRTFIQEYIQALSAQNDGIAVAQRFVKRHVLGTLYALLSLEI